MVARDAAPLRTFLRGVLGFFSNAERWANAINGMAAFIVFAAGFSVLKGAITYFAPFAWDQWLADAERQLHFGRHPYEWLGWFVGSPSAIGLIDFLYNFWFVVVLGTTFSVCITERDTRLRHTYLLSFMLLWLVGGFFVAMAFSSAGPCYYARLGLGDEYQALAAALTQASRSHSVSALATQDMLWSGYKGLRNGNLGISAFPSLHVGSAVLVALYATARSRAAGVLAWMFALAIAIASVVLGWHYALDAYGGAAIAVLAWYAVGSAVGRLTPRALADR
jgi:membrane-associated phospholipid phosphatase